MKKLVLLLPIMLCLLTAFDEALGHYNSHRCSNSSKFIEAPNPVPPCKNGNKYSFESPKEQKSVPKVEQKETAEQPVLLNQGFFSSVLGFKKTFGQFWSDLSSSWQSYHPYDKYSTKKPFDNSYAEKHPKMGESCFGSEDERVCYISPDKNNIPMIREYFKSVCIRKKNDHNQFNDCRNIVREMNKLNRELYRGQLLNAFAYERSELLSAYREKYKQHGCQKLRQYDFNYNEYEKLHENFSSTLKSISRDIDFYERVDDIGFDKNYYDFMKEVDHKEFQQKRKAFWKNLMSNYNPFN